MAEPALAAGQYSIGPEGGPALVYGRGTSTLVASTETDTGTMTVQDQAVTGQDGLLFGVDTMAGMIITQTGQCMVPGSGASALDAYGALAGSWNAPATRLANGAVQVLRAMYPFATAARRCYGRGRKIMPSLGLVNQGLVPFTAQFQASDGIWYSDTLFSIELTTVPTPGGGASWPLSWPVTWVQSPATRSNTVQNAGPQPTWPVITFTGPVFSPVLNWVNAPVSVGYAGVLKQSDRLVIDTRPWARTALLNGQSAAGALTGSPMISLQFQPGSTPLFFAGTDLTGTATCQVSWRNASLSIGGTT